MMHPIDDAREHGVELLYSIDSADNYSTQALAKDLSMHIETDPNNSKQFIYSLYL